MFTQRVQLNLMNKNEAHEEDEDRGTEHPECGLEGARANCRKTASHFTPAAARGDGTDVSLEFRIHQRKYRFRAEVKTADRFVTPL